MSEAIKMFTTEAEDFAYATAIEDLDVSNPNLWDDQSYWPIFERLRNEAPLHYCKSPWESPFRLDDSRGIGPYWSVTRYEDIMAIDTNHKAFSSEPTIVLPDPDDDFTLPMIYRSVFPFVLVMILTLVLVMVFPQIALWLPATLL